MYDYLIVGAGLFGSVFAHEAARAGKKVLVIDKRNNFAGNVYTEKDTPTPSYYLYEKCVHHIHAH